LEESESETSLVDLLM